LDGYVPDFLQAPPIYTNARDGGDLHLMPPRANWLVARITEPATTPAG